MARESPRGSSTAELEAAVTLSELRQVLATLEATDGRGAIDGRVSARDVEALCSSIAACKRTTRDCSGQQRSSHDKSLASTRRRCMPCMLGLSRGASRLRRAARSLVRQYSVGLEEIDEDGINQILLSILRGCLSSPLQID